MITPPNVVILSDNQFADGRLSLFRVGGWVVVSVGVGVCWSINPLVNPLILADTSSFFSHLHN